MQYNRKLNMLVVCRDEHYLKSIEYRLAEALYDKVNIAYISDYECLKKYNTEPKNIDILLIEERLYEEVINRQNCKNVYVLVEDEARTSEETGNYSIIYKYSSIRFIIDKIDSELLQSTENSFNMNTKIVSVYSPLGGCGKTTVALGLAKQLGSKGYKVLFFSTEMLQDYQTLLSETNSMPEKIGYDCSIHIEDAAEKMLQYVKKDTFEYFPAWKRMLPAYGIHVEELLHIITYIQKKNIYDYIVVELSCEVRAEKLNFLYKSDRVVLVMRQDEMAVKKLKKFMSSVVEWKEQAVVVCNFYDSSQKDFLVDNQIKFKYSVCETIEKLNAELDLPTIEDMHILEKTIMAVL